MAISHELSSEIAAALFAAKGKSPRELDVLKEIVFEIHSSLEQLGDAARMNRRKAQAERARDAAGQLGTRER